MQRNTTGCGGRGVSAQLLRQLSEGPITPIVPIRGPKPPPGSVLPPLEGNISPPQPAPWSPPFKSGNGQCIPFKKGE